MTKKVVVIGGGHGQATIINGLKEIEDIELSAIVTVADDGGSTGRIRNIYNIPAMGDIRNVICSLADKDNIYRDLLEYRFNSPIAIDHDVIGHNLGNLILTALTDLRGDFYDAIKVTCKMLDIKTKVIPSSLDVITLYAIMDDGTMVKGEDNIPSYNHHIRKVFYQDTVKACEDALKAIEEADLIIYGIGSIYTSILPNIIIPDILNSLKKTKAIKIYFANAMTQNNETFDYDVKDHVDALEEHGAPIDLIIKHNDVIPFYIKSRYLNQNSIEVTNGKNTRQKVLECSLLDFSDNRVRHDSRKIKKVVEEILRNL